MIRNTLTAVALVLALPAAAQAQDVVRTYANPTAFIAQMVVVPAGYETIYVSGMLPDPVTPAAAGAPAAYGDTETQAANVFGKIERALKTQGLGLGDVVSMTIYMVGDPAKGGRMDFQGMMTSYNKMYGTPAQPNRPSRSTVQVAALAAVGPVLEVEVTAVRKPAK